LKVAILGGGGVGCAAAIEIARAGHSVDVFETRADILLGASRVNEGKIHQGFIYAKDDPDLTARTMAEGALAFQQILARWMDVEKTVVKSVPFTYALHRASQLDADQLKAHFDRCCAIFNEIQDGSGRSYLGSKERAAYWELPTTEVHGLLDERSITRAYGTTEYAVDPRPIAKALEQSVRSDPRIQIRCHTHVSSVSTEDTGYYIRHSSDKRDGPYDQVVNATWEGRLLIDASIGLPQPTQYSIRHKFGHRVAIKLRAEDLPSITTVLGPFGDIVNFGKNGFYLSWYPHGMTDMIANSSVDAAWYRISREERLRNFQTSQDAWKGLCPSLGQLSFSEEAIDPASGMIFAIGDTDIDQLDSKLHSRCDVGIQSVDGYHSVNTGKFTLFPQMAIQVAERVLGSTLPI